MQFSRFSVLLGSAEAQVNWCGMVKCLLMAYFIGNISAKRYQNPFTSVKVIASQMWDVFWDMVYTGHGHLCVSLSLAAFLHYCTDPDVTSGNGRVPSSCALLGGFAIGASACTRFMPGFIIKLVLYKRGGWGTWEMAMITSGWKLLYN